MDQPRIRAIPATDDGFMLKRLELIGFKSFADKTTFEFGNGITAIVGPNGSGKSNIVDAVRWILGEQSAKSLRGGEMADVIFNGSTSRRSLGLAEVTMTFDNQRRTLATEATEVQITRRVYRDGQGEYLINQQICRLKDIKELFLGSGAGNDAYCIIEQGKVDVLLQASTRERRIIFEEAAGISRFKAKKIETQRKLERVDQNLQRLKDIVEEVDKQLRSVKLQAAKAERYQEYSTRLRELRLAVGLEEFHQLGEKLRSETIILDNLKADMQQRADRAASFEEETRRLDAVLAALEDELHQEEARLAAARQEIKAQETTLGHEESLIADLEVELRRTRGQLAELTQRVTGLAEALLKVEIDLQDARAQAEQQRQTSHENDRELEAVVQRLADLHAEVEAGKTEHLEQMRQAARLQNEAVVSRAQIDSLRREEERLRHKSAQAAESLAHLDLEMQELTQADEALQVQVGAARQALAGLRQDREQTRQLRDDTSEQVSSLRQLRSGLASRIEVLQGLIRSHEGLGTGVREVLALLEQPDPGPWQTVLGMVADFLTVRREFAPLIDLALGEWAQRFVVRDAVQLVEALNQKTEPFSGRVSFLPMMPPAEGNGTTGYHRPHAHTLLRLAGSGRNVETAVLNAPVVGAGLPAHPGVVAPAEQLVSCDNPQLADLPRRLLGKTLIVRDLAAARAIAELDLGYRLVTMQGEVLEPDGTLTVGKHLAETGILSRKSELQHLQEQVADLDHRIIETDRDLGDLRERLTHIDQVTGEKQEEIQVLAEQAADMRARLERHRDRRQGLHEEVTVSRGEIDRVAAEIADLQRQWEETRTQASTAEIRVQELSQRIHQADQEIRQCEAARATWQQACTAARVALAKAEERLAALNAQHEQIAGDVQQRRLEQERSEQNLASCRQRMADSQQTMLAASATMARAYLDKETSERQAAELMLRREKARQDRTHAADQAQTVRNEWQIQREHIHTRELEAAELKHKQESFADRLREDYQVDLAELYQQAWQAGRWAKRTIVPAPAELSAAPTCEAPAADAAEAQTPAHALPAVDPAQAEQEIEELRRKLHRLGSVNLEALQELADLESRSKTLQAQLDDLTSAKRSLEEIINKINQDSRRLFEESFASIKTHFQELFRKLFGGGMADIVFEDENDILESGIEIIARPPGKELRSISLMSGGEKTLTAVALLLAIFRSKPSPFCILDEVDAALDEANIGRFTDVLREFLDRSQFILVTHSKKTMAAADVLYGITMQESGISKQVSIRFEDWPDDPPVESKEPGPTASPASSPAQA
jgi:chromosome segregation protein